MYLRRRVPHALFAVLLLAIVACSSGNSTVPQPSEPTVTLPSGGTAVELTASGSAVSFTVTEQDYAGAFTAVSSDTSVATVAPSSASGSGVASLRRDAVATAEFTITPVGAGSATITVTDARGNATHISVTVAASTSASPSSSPTTAPTPTPTPPPPGVLSVSPTTMTIAGTGNENAQQILVQETGYSGTFSQTNNCSTLATIATSSAAGPIATYTVTGINAGTCTATFSDSNAQQVVVSITVTTSGFTIQTIHRKGI